MPTPEDLAADPRFPWTRDLSPNPWPPPPFLSPPRHGVQRAVCSLCARPDTAYLWADEHWRVLPFTDVPLRGCVILERRMHADSFVDLPSDVSSSLGP